MYLQRLMIFSSLVAAALSECPSSCTCLPDLSVVERCSGHTSIPDIDFSSTRELDFSNNHIPLLQRSNFTRLTNVVNLMLRGCSITTIEHHTFIDLTHMKLLDLSNNNIQVLAGGSLSNLNLDFFYMENNPRLTLRNNAFEGMSTKLLSLKDCGLTTIDAQLFTPLTTMKTLKLENNKIERFPSEMLAVFRRIDKLRIHSNPLICDCESQWLKEFYDLNRDKIRDGALGNVEEPRCSEPDHLAGQFMHLISRYDFNCVKPTLSANITFTKDKGILSCTSGGNPLPDVSWYKPNGDVIPSHPNRRDQRTSNLLELMPTDNVKGMYTCMASNNAGNITFSVNVDWPFQPTTNEQTAKPCQSLGVNSADKMSAEDSVTKSQTSDTTAADESAFKVKYFTIVDLIAAIFGTFICTLVSTVLTLHFCVYRRKDNSNSPYSTSSVSDYSSSSATSDKNHPGTCHIYPNKTFSPLHVQLPSTPGHLPYNHQRPLPMEPCSIYDQHHYMSTTVPDRNTNSDFIPLSAHSSQGRMTPRCESCPACRPMSNGTMGNQLS